MELTACRLHVWKQGETIAGYEFVAANEAVVDYLSTLRRPQPGVMAIRYDCLAKLRRIQPLVQTDNLSTSNRDWINLLTVYELRDCKALE